jgi:hypothetical protein
VASFATANFTERNVESDIVLPVKDLALGHMLRWILSSSSVHGNLIQPVQ